MTAGHGVRFGKRGVQRGLSLAKSKRGCGIVPLSRRSGSDWEGEGNDRRSWGEVLQATGAEGLVGAANGERGWGIVPLSRRSASDWEGEGNDRRSWGEVLQARGRRGVCRGRTVSDVAALCPSPEGPLAIGRERGMTAGHGVRFCKRGRTEWLRYYWLLTNL